MKEASANILLLGVDDDESALEVLEMVLEENEVTKFSLHNSKEGFYSMKNSDINLILIDHRLNGDDAGLEIIKEVRQWNEDNYIIIMSGIKDFDTAVEYTNLGANKFIYKYWGNYREKLINALREGFHEARKRIERAIKLKKWEESAMKGMDEIGELTAQLNTKYSNARPNDR